MIGKRNQARRKAEAKELFQSMLKAKHTVVIPDAKKGTRAENKRKAINEQV